MNRSQRGNGFLEILLFAPAAMLILLATIDCGLALRERSLLRQAVRSGLNAQALAFRDQPIETANFALGQRLNGNSPEISSAQLLDQVAAETFTGIFQALISTPNSAAPAPELKIEGQLLLVNIEEESGRYSGYESISGARIFPAGSRFSLQAEFPDVVEKSLDDYLAAFFRGEHHQVRSGFAVPLLGGLGSSSPKFAQSTQAIAFKITAAAHGLPRSPFRSLFQSIFAIQEFAVFPTRRQLG